MGVALGQSVPKIQVPDLIASISLASTSDLQKTNPKTENSDFVFLPRTY